MRWIFLLLALLPGGAQAADEVRLTNGEWPPYLGQSLPHHGVASRIVTEAFALQGITVRWEFHPWARSLRMAEQGARDGSAVWLYSPEREQRFYISEPVVESGYYLFHRRNQPFDWNSLEDLRGLRIAGVRGYDYGEDFQQAEAAGKFDIQRLTGDEQGLRQLLAGRADLAPLDKVVAFDLLYQKFSAQERRLLSFHPQPLRSDSLHLLLSREVAGNAERMERFNRGLAQLRESGRISRYLLDIQQPLSLGH